MVTASGSTIIVAVAVGSSRRRREEIEPRQRWGKGRRKEKDGMERGNSGLFWSGYSLQLLQKCLPLMTPFCSVVEPAKTLYIERKKSLAKRPLESSAIFERRSR